MPIGSARDDLGQILVQRLFDSRNAILTDIDLRLQGRQIECRDLVPSRTLTDPEDRRSQLLQALLKRDDPLSEGLQDVCNLVEGLLIHQTYTITF